MADIVSPARRSAMMAGIKGKHTKPELVIRHALHRIGFRYKLHDKTLPGKPDLVFPRYKAALFVHGCFWHGHDCALFKMPSSRTEFWRKKIARNKEIDDSSVNKLIASGWRVGIIWECSLRGRKKHNFLNVIEACKNWLRSEVTIFEIRGES